MPVQLSEIIAHSTRMASFDVPAAIIAHTAAMAVYYGPRSFVYGAASVSEDDTNGAVVADLLDVDGGAAPLVWSLTDDANSRFAINSATGQITLADDTQIDFDTNSSHPIEILVTDSNGKTKSGGLTIAVEDPGVESPAFTITLDTNVVEAGSTNGASIGTLTAPDAVGTVSWAFDTGGNPGSIFAIGSSTGELTLADSGQIDASQAASHSVTVAATDDNGTVTDSFTIVVAGDCEVVTEVAADRITTTADSVSVIRHPFTLASGVNRKITIEAGFEGESPFVTSATAVLLDDQENQIDSLTALPIQPSTAGPSSGLFSALFRYDFSDALAAGDYFIDVTPDQQATTGGFVAHVQYRAASQGGISNVQRIVYPDDGGDGQSFSFPSYTTQTNGAAVRSFIVNNNDGDSWTHYANGTESYDASAGGIGVSASGTHEIRSPDGAGTVSHQSSGPALRAIAHAFSVSPFRAKLAPEEPPPEEGTVINVPEMSIEALSDAYNQVTAHDTILQLPAGFGSITSGWAQPAGGFRVHIRGATSWQPDADYLTVDVQNDAAVQAALDGFEPASEFSTVGAGGGSFAVITLNVPGSTVSRLAITGRGDSDRGILVNEAAIENTLIYWCRLNSMGSGGIRFQGAAKNALVTDCVIDGTPGTIAGVLLWWSGSASVYDTIDHADHRGQFNMPYVQRCLFRNCGHAVDWTRNGVGVMRQCRCVTHNTFASPQARLHGYWLTQSGAEIAGVRYFEVYDCVHWADANTWRFIEVKGGDGIVADCVANDDTGGGFMQLSIESLQRVSPPNPDNCNDTTYPEPQQTRELYIDSCTYQGVAVSDAGGQVKGICGTVLQLNRDYFFGAHPTWVKPGAHPLMPSDIP